jgi:hypothetical protein
MTAFQKAKFGILYYEISTDEGEFQEVSYFISGQPTTWSRPEACIVPVDILKGKNYNLIFILQFVLSCFPQHLHGASHSSFRPIP